MKWKKIDDWTSGTVNMILRRHPNGFAGFVVQGERGMGKSMYAYKVMAKIYQTLGELNEYDAYFKALEYMIFSPHELIELIKHNLKHHVITPVLCLDDATVHFSSYKYFIDLYEVILLKGMFDTIRTVLTGLLLTCPKRRNLLRFLKDYDDYKIQILTPREGGNQWHKLARCYHFHYYPDETKYRVWVPYQDHYSIYVPGKEDDITSPYGAYYNKREKYLEIINDKLEEMMKVKGKLARAT